MKCFKCGKEIDDNSKFCFYCGEKISAKNDDSQFGDKEYSSNISLKNKIWIILGICVMLVVIVGAACVPKIKQKMKEEEKMQKNRATVQKAMDQITKLQGEDEMSVFIHASEHSNASYNGTSTVGDYSISSYVDFKDGEAHLREGDYYESVDVYGDEYEFEAFLTSDGDVIRSENSGDYEEVGSVSFTAKELLAFFDDDMKKSLLLDFEHGECDIGDDDIVFEFFMDGEDYIYQNYINYLDFAGVNPEQEYDVENNIEYRISIPRKAEDEILRITISFPDVENIWFGSADDGLEFSSATGEFSITFYNREIEDFTIPEMPAENGEDFLSYSGMDRWIAASKYLMSGITLRDLMADGLEIEQVRHDNSLGCDVIVVDYYSMRFKCTLNEVDLSEYKQNIKDKDYEDIFDMMITSADVP